MSDLRPLPTLWSLLQRKDTMKKAISIRLDEDILAKLDAWREAQPATPSRTACIDAALRLLLENDPD